MKLTKEDAKECPFCGNQPSLLRSRKYPTQSYDSEPFQNYIVSCVSSKCLMKPKIECTTKHEALKSWNIRKEK